MESSFSTSIAPLPSQATAPEFTKRLGQGSFGTIDLHFGLNIKSFARKSIHCGKSAIPESHPISREYYFLKMARIENAPNIIQLVPPQAGVSDSVQRDSSGDYLYFDIEYAELGNLTEYFKNNPNIRVTQEMVCWVGLQVASGLAWLHSRCIIHGDLKPENLLVCNGPGLPTVKIGDLGSALQIGSGGVDSKRTIRFCLTTHLYAAPEMLMAGIDMNKINLYAREFKHLIDFLNPVITVASDIFSLGLILYEISGTQHPCYPHPRTPKGIYFIKNLCQKHEARPKQFLIYMCRLKPTADFLELLKNLTSSIPLGRPTSDHLRRDPVLVRGYANFKIQKWEEPGLVDELVLEAQNLRSQLNPRETEIDELKNQLEILRGRTGCSSTIQVTTPLPLNTNLQSPPNTANAPIPSHTIFKRPKTPIAHEILTTTTQVLSNIQGPISQSILISDSPTSNSPLKRMTSFEPLITPSQDLIIIDENSPPKKVGL